MKQGFYDELDELRKEDSDACFRFLENIVVSADQNAFDYLHGLCPDFAAMLSDIYGYAIETVRHWEEEGCYGRLVHAYCVTEIQGETAYVDVRGITTDPVLFFEEFENEITYDPRDDELWDLEGPATVEWWENKDALFDGDFEGWTDEYIKAFILMNANCYDVAKLDRKKPLDMTIEQASSQSIKAIDSVVKCTPER